MGTGTVLRASRWRGVLKGVIYAVNCSRKQLSLRGQRHPPVASREDSCAEFRRALWGQTWSQIRAPSRGAFHSPPL